MLYVPCALRISSCMVIPLKQTHNDALIVPSDHMHYFLYTVSSELEQMFIKQSTLEVYFEWLDSVIERNVKEVRMMPLHFLH